MRADFPSLAVQTSYDAAAAMAGIALEMEGITIRYKRGILDATESMKTLENMYGTLRKSISSGNEMKVQIAKRHST